MKKWGQLWKTTLQLGVCLLLLGWVFAAIFYHQAQVISDARHWSSLSRLDKWKAAWHQGPQELWQTLKILDPGALTISLLLMGLILVLGVVRWQMVLKVQGFDIPFVRTARISIIAHFFNSFLLGSIGGDVLKAYYVARETHHKKTEAVVTVLVDRLLGLFSLLVFACVMMLPNLDMLTRTYKLRLLAAFVFAMTCGCGVIVGLSFWGGVSKRVPKARVWLRKLPKGDLLEKAVDACREFGKDKGFLLKITLISVALNLVCVLHFLSLTWGFFLKVPVVPLSVIVPMVTSISSLPISPPGGLGVRENLYVYILHEIGIDPAKALLLSLIGYAGSLLWSGVGGLVYATQREKEHLQEIAHPPENAID